MELDRWQAGGVAQAIDQFHDRFGVAWCPLGYLVGILGGFGDLFAGLS